MIEQLASGTWTARWSDWVVKLKVKSDKCDATVWRWTVGGGYTERMQLGARNDFSSSKDAVAWACDVLRDNGVKVMILDKPSITLESLLRFNPAPEACA